MVELITQATQFNQRLAEDALATFVKSPELFEAVIEPVPVGAYLGWLGFVSVIALFVAFKK